MARIGLPQFESEYDMYKMRTLVDELERQFANLGSGSHGDLTGLTDPGSHPTSAITGLDEELSISRTQRYFLGE